MRRDLSFWILAALAALGVAFVIAGVAAPIIESLT
jgi:hypothetical protein